jgi:hypothetical protein
LPNGSKSRPDFLVECPDGNSVYLEAVSASARDGRNPGGQARIETALQHLDDAEHPDFFLEISSTGYPMTQPSGRGLTMAVMKWLRTLNADAVIGLTERNDFDLLPSMCWAYEEWELTVTAIPCRPDARGRPLHRLIGVRNGGANWVDGWTPIRDAVMDKGRRYGDIKIPLIVAVNVNASHLDVIDEVQALFLVRSNLFFRAVPVPKYQECSELRMALGWGRLDRDCDDAAVRGCSTMSRRILWAGGRIRYTLTLGRTILYQRPS